MSADHQHAVVVGGAVAGLLTARALADVFAKVTIVERDELPDRPVARRGVPQGSHLHNFLMGGRLIIEEMLPGFTQEMRDSGAAYGDVCQIAPRYTGLGWTVRADSGLRTLFMRRPVLETGLRARIGALPAISIERGTVTDLTAVGARVTGVEIAEEGATRTLEADLVVDASGRGSRAPQWLTGLGYPRPDEVTVNSYLGYSSQLIQIPDEAWPGDMRGVVALPFPGATRGAVILPQENGTFVITVAGQSKDYPPATRDELIAFLGAANSPVPGEVYRRAEPLGDVSTTRTGVNRVRRYDVVGERPARFLVLGDAACAFNPIYGQGMTTAAVHAKTLRDMLLLHPDLDRIADTFPHALMAASRFPWQVATQVDVNYDGAESHGVESLPPDPTLAEAMRDLNLMSTEDPEAMSLFYYAMATMDPDAMTTDDVRTKAAAWRAAGKQPLYPDPAHPPLYALDASPAQ